MDRRIGKYEILEEIGLGGMAVVYKARDTLLERTVALKVINQRLKAHEVAYQRFLNEAKVGAGLTHPNIVVVHELGLEEGRPFIAMEYLPGWDLRELIERQHPLGLRQKVNIALQIARALQHAHSRGVIHRDVKPGNIRLLPDGTIKLMDFGIAKLTNEALNKLTKTGAVIGTVSYMSPEQLQGGALTPATDLFSFGLVLYELISGTHPFDASNPTAVIYRIISEPAPPIVDQEVPQTLRVLLEDCLKKSPQQRVSGFDAVVARLLRIKTQLRKPETGAESSLPLGAPSPIPSSQPTRSDTQPTVDVAAVSAEAPRRWPLGLLGLLGGGLCLGTLAVLAVFSAREVPPPSGPTPRPSPRSEPPVVQVVAPPPTAAPTDSPRPDPASAFTSLPPLTPSLPPTPLSTPSLPPTSTRPPTPLPISTQPPTPLSTPSLPPTSTRPPTPLPISTQPPTPLSTPSLPPTSTRPPTPLPISTQPPTPPPTPTRPLTRAPTPARKPVPSRPPAPDLPTPTPEGPIAATGTLRLLVEPWAYVRIDRGEERQSPLRPVTLDVGEHQLELFRDGFYSIEQTILIRPGQTTSLTLELQREKFGIVKIFLEGAPWAYFQIDDSEERQLPHAALRLADGKHILNVYREGYQRVIRRFEVLSDQETEIHIELKK